MIAKHIQCKIENDNYSRLVKYIEGEDQPKPENKAKDEKVLTSWSTCCEGMPDEYSEEPFDYTILIKEIEATQAMNTRSKREKTYHLMISFRPEDENKLNPDKYKEIERIFANNLGFDEHQRICAIHKNTANIHMHIAYNMINPKTFKRHAPYFDYHKLQKSCREAENIYKLSTDKVINHNKNENTTNTKAQDYETYTMQQSFSTYIDNKKEYINDALTKSSNWNEFHNELAKMGFLIKGKGNGLIFQDLEKKYSIKASAINRNFSLKQITNKFGQFQPINQEELSRIKINEKYEKQPLKNFKDNNDLYKEFISEMEIKRNEVSKIKNKEKLMYDEIISKFEIQKLNIKYSGMNRFHKKELLAQLKNLQNAELKQSRDKARTESMEARNKRPYKNWASFLTYNASKGNEQALEILRFKSNSNRGQTDTILSENQQIENMSIKKLNHIKIMEEAIKATKSQTKDNEKLFKYTIDTNGIIIYTFNDKSGTIKDTGTEIFFNANEPCKITAIKYASLKWGSVAINDNKITKRSQQIETTITR